MLRQRLRGLALMLLGVACLGLLTQAWRFGWFQPYVPSIPRLPGGMPPESLLVVNPFACLSAMLVLGALGLIALGLRDLLFPDEWDPPKHLGR